MSHVEIEKFRKEQFNIMKGFIQWILKEAKHKHWTVIVKEATLTMGEVKMRDRKIQRLERAMQGHPSGSQSWYEKATE